MKTLEFDEYISSLPEKTDDQIDLASCVEELINSGIVEHRPLSHTHDANMLGKNPLTKDQYYEMAWNTLRQKFQLWNEVKVTIQYFEKLEQVIAKQNKIRAEEARRRKLMQTFEQALRACDQDENGNEVPAYIRYDEDAEAYYLKVDKDEEELADVSFTKYGNSLYGECKEYFAFVAFARKNDEAYINPLKDKLKLRLADKTKRAADRKNGEVMADELQKVRERTQKIPQRVDYPMASVMFVREAEKIEPGLAQKIRDFYDKLINELPR